MMGSETTWHHEPRTSGSSFGHIFPVCLTGSQTQLANMVEPPFFSSGDLRYCSPETFSVKTTSSHGLLIFLRKMTKKREKIPRKHVFHSCMLFKHEEIFKQSAQEDVYLKTTLMFSLWDSMARGFIHFSRLAVWGCVLFPLQTTEWRQDTSHTPHRGCQKRDFSLKLLFFSTLFQFHLYLFQQHVSTRCGRTTGWQAF